MEPTQPLDRTPDENSEPRPFTRIEGEEEAPGPRSRRRLFYVLVAYIVAMIAIALVAFFQGRTESTVLQESEIQGSLAEQFELGETDLAEGRFEVARQRFEAVALYDPDYPGLEEKLVAAYVMIDVPSITPTLLPTSTPDPSPPEQLFQHAQEAFASGDWDTVVNKLLSLRAKDPSYRAYDADGLMFLALRNRGMDRISQGFMEEGLYDLSLAARFGPLDRDALFRQTLAQQYLLANSYLGLNWGRAADLFKPLCDQGATLDSCYKYADAAQEYGDLLWVAEDPCGSMEYYLGSLEAWTNPELEPTADHAEDACADATAPPPPPPPTETPTPTETPDGG